MYNNKQIFTIKNIKLLTHRPAFTIPYKIDLTRKIKTLSPHYKKKARSSISSQKKINLKSKILCQCVSNLQTFKRRQVLQSAIIIGQFSTWYSWYQTQNWQAGQNSLYEVKGISTLDGISIYQWSTKTVSKHESK